MSYRQEYERSCCGEFMCLLFLLMIYSLLITSNHVNIDEYNLDLWDREHGLEPCCMRDEHGVIRDRNTKKVQWKKMVKDKNPYWSTTEWSDFSWEDEQ